MLRDVPGGPITEVMPYPVRQTYRSELGIYTAEAQQILQHERYAFIGGARYQIGQFDTSNTNAMIPGYVNAGGWVFPSGAFDNPLQQVESDFSA